LKEDKGGIFGFGILNGGLLSGGFGLNRTKVGNIISFDLHPKSPNNAEKVAAWINSNKGRKIQEYNSYAVSGQPDIWGITVMTQQGQMIFVLKNPEDHKKIDAFIRSVRYGDWHITGAQGHQNTVTIIRNK